MSNLTKGLILVVAILAIGVGLVVWKKRVGGETTASFNSISKSEIEMLLADVAKTNPTILKRLAEDPELKKQQIENLKQLLAFASQAQRDGLAADPTNKQELDSIRAEILAVNYDREINKDKGPMPPFGFISEEQVKAYWDQDSQPAAKGFFEKIGLGGPTETRTHETEFNDFLNAKIEVLKASSPEMKDREITDEEKTQARDVFAKIRIYRAEYDQKASAGELSKEFIEKANLQVKLQQAQFLARLYSEKITDKTKVTDEDIAKYIAEHPELDPAQKRATAQGILDRAKAGEDFAALANEFSQDPGNKGGADGVAQGGLYKDVPKGRMVAPFEAAALALEPGQIASELVETDFGFHIIKLERKLGPSAAKAPKTGNGEGTEPTGDTYDVRHILITTGYKDPDNPNAREAPIKDYVRQKLEKEKEKKVLEEIVASNNIQVPDDFTVPAVSDEQIKQMQQKQQMQGMPPGGPGGPGEPGEVDPGKPGKSEPKKPETKKK
ncbi:MAG: peptidylprolyl isomerase [Pyrinomonadaceae bacterium]